MYESRHLQRHFGATSISAQRAGPKKGSGVLEFKTPDPLSVTDPSACLRHLAARGNSMKLLSLAE